MLRCYANDKDVLVCAKFWAQNSDVDNNHCASGFGKYSHDGNEEWIVSCLMLEVFNEQYFYN